jgi:hypothetical protein
VSYAKRGYHRCRKGISKRCRGLPVQPNQLAGGRPAPGDVGLVKPLLFLLSRFLSFG